MVIAGVSIQPATSGAEQALAFQTLYSARLSSVGADQTADRAR